MTGEKLRNHNVSPRETTDQSQSGCSLSSFVTKSQTQCTSDVRHVISIPAEETVIPVYETNESVGADIVQLTQPGQRGW